MCTLACCGHQLIISKPYLSSFPQSSVLSPWPSSINDLICPLNTLNVESYFTSSSSVPVMILPVCLCLNHGLLVCLRQALSLFSSYLPPSLPPSLRPSPLLFLFLDFGMLSMVVSELTLRTTVPWISQGLRGLCGLPEIPRWHFGHTHKWVSVHPHTRKRGHRFLSLDQGTVEECAMII